MEKQEFITKIAAYVQKYAPKYDIRVHSPIIAQAILESGWGKSTLSARYHNYFGLKCGTKWTGPSVNMTTQEEYEEGVHTTIQDNFRVYGSMEEGVKGYFEFIQLSRYHNLRGITDPEAYLITIRADGYATSYSYVSENMKLIRQYNLEKYDTEKAEVNGMSAIEKAVQQMETWARDDDHGYDQIYRWGEKGDYDCSSATIQACENAGIPVKSAGATYTENMKQAFLACGFKDVTNSVNRKTGSGLIRGDVLLNEKKHVAMYCGNGKEVEASINEKGTATGGKPGDQTGKEFLIRPYRDYPWDCVLRYKDTGNSSSGSAGNSNAAAEEKKRTTVNYVARMSKDTKCYVEPGGSQAKLFPQIKKDAVVDVMKYTKKDSKGKTWYFIRLPHPTEGFVFEFVPGGSFRHLK